MIPNYIEGFVLTLHCFNINIHVFNNCIVLLAKVFPNDKYGDTKHYPNAQGKKLSKIVSTFTL